MLKPQTPKTGLKQYFYLQIFYILRSLNHQDPIWQKQIKQYVVTNCGKERPSSIGTKTLKNGIFIPIATSKESHFNSNFKYISFIKFSVTHQKLRA